MKVIDKQGKVFGKINLIDLLLILIVIAAAIFFGVRYMKSNDVVSAGNKVMISFYGEEVPDFSITPVKVGDKITDDTGNVDLGTVTKIETGPSESWGNDVEGNFVKSPKEGYSSLIITAEADGYLFEHGAMIGGSKYTIGHSTVLRAGHGKFYLKVYDVQDLSASE